MSNYLAELNAFRGLILDDANLVVDQDVMLKVGNHTICLQINSDLFDNIDQLIIDEIKRVTEEKELHNNLAV